MQEYAGFEQTNWTVMHNDACLHLLMQKKLLELNSEIVLASWGEGSGEKFLRLPRLLKSMNDF